MANGSPSGARLATAREAPSADLFETVAPVLRLTSPVIHKVLAGMNGAQLRVVVRHIRHLM